MSVALETFANPEASRQYLIRHLSDEFTSVCPKTGHPDFGQVLLNYVPGEHCIELKAYKLYLQAFRNEGIFYEAVTNRILVDLIDACVPQWMRVETLWRGRGGIRSIVCAEHAAEGFQAVISLPPLTVLA
jgi:7-cyano-7-deazaguanine reductase